MNSLPVENVQEYPRSPTLESVAQRLLVRLGGETIAETVYGYRVLETHHAPTYYFPRNDVFANLNPAPGPIFCEGKCSASYFDVSIGSATAKRAAWTYENPTKCFKPIAGYVAFYAGMVEQCYVDNERVIPQPGSFYGGWVTSNLEGVPKGARGSKHW